MKRQINALAVALLLLTCSCTKITTNKKSSSPSDTMGTMTLNYAEGTISDKRNDSLGTLVWVNVYNGECTIGLTDNSKGIQFVAEDSKPLGDTSFLGTYSYHYQTGNNSVTISTNTNQYDVDTPSTITIISVDSGWVKGTFSQSVINRFTQVKSVATGSFRVWHNS
jgi:hypothetical protein